MRNNKSLLHGLGAGLISGAVLLQLMDAAADARQTPIDVGSTPPVAEMDKEQLREAASQYYQVIEKDVTIYTQAQLDEQLQQLAQQQAASSQAVASQTVKEIHVYISNGMTASQVGELLTRSGIIADRTAFEEAMAKRQLNYKIVAGVYAFQPPAELSQVIAAITS
ncbi:hypothetical protein [Paenibacillus xerothermodurans]|uniref:Aminodeoxychorismate lyase n=1 Tax=Paenibacillus xerothermodurans TaxID=1977292 RepID=A0A2W1NS88_PAEXE|nr:hypothetical protein [Paenibacillus xerothermodurans]PZE22425.1 hypothetical protein CBW46_001175 [Paenibacillus xerothermodurans]